MDPNKFLDEVMLKSTQQKHFYHFTDRRNESSIGKHGLLSAQEAVKRGVEIAVPGGNDWSQERDRRCGMDSYVHLCFFRQHPMEYCAKNDGRIDKTIWFAIKPEIITQAGVLITAGVSNKADVHPRPATEMLDEIDLEVIYQRTNWNDPEVRERLQAARKYELLIPEMIARDHILDYVKRDG